MALKKFNPTTPGQRNLVLVDKGDLYKGKPVKKLTQGLTKSGGRNNSGHVTSWHRGGGHKRRYRMIDFKRTKTGMMATVERLEYDPNRTAFIALITYDDGEQSYILAPQRLAVGDKVMSGTGSDIKPGNALPLASIPVGTLVHNVELKPGKGGQLARSAGTYIQLVGRDRGYAILRLTSGEVRLAPSWIQLPSSVVVMYVKPSSTTCVSALVDRLVLKKKSARQRAQAVPAAAQQAFDKGFPKASLAGLFRCWPL